MRPVSATGRRASHPLARRFMRSSGNSPIWPQWSRALVGLLLALHLLLVLRNAWLSDDAYITLRTVDQFTHGGGLVWNPGERVQVYTHPLWMFALSSVYFVTGEAYYTTLALSIVVSLLAAWCLARAMARISPTAAVVVLVPLVFSRSYVDYATSGLENPAAHLLLALIFDRWLVRPGDEAGCRRQAFAIWLLSGLLVLTRLDLGLIALPLCLELAWREGRRDGLVRLLRPITLAALPLVAWELFSLVYYGALVPNTALGKLATGIPPHMRIQQGLNYLLASAAHDPVASLTLLAGLVAGLRWRPGIALSIGSILYLYYTVKVGGGFMAGRFWTVPMVVAAATLAGALARISDVEATKSPDGPDPRSALPEWASIALVALAAMMTPRPVWTPPLEAEGKPDLPHGIMDEQRFWYPASGLMARSRLKPDIDHGYRDRGEQLEAGEVLVWGSIGYLGFHADRKAIIVDYYGLTDPFLARLPIGMSASWRPGHYARETPPGYVASLREGQNLVNDVELARLYDDVRLIHSAPLFADGRWAAIFRQGLGMRGAEGEAVEALRRPLVRHDAESLEALPAKPLKFDRRGLALELGKAMGKGKLELDLRPPGDYELLWRRGDSRVAHERLHVPKAPQKSAGKPRRVKIPGGATELWIFPYTPKAKAELVALETSRLSWPEPEPPRKTPEVRPVTARPAKGP